MTGHPDVAAQPHDGPVAALWVDEPGGPREEPPDGAIIRAYDGQLVIERDDDAAGKGSYPPGARWWPSFSSDERDEGPWTWADACVRWPQLLDEEETVRLFREDDPAIAVLPVVCVDHPARRDDAVAAWLKRRRDEHCGDGQYRDAINGVLDDYRDHADTGTPLDRDVPEPHEEADR